MRRTAAGLLVGVGALLFLGQAVPYGRRWTNPAGQREPAWDSGYTRELAVRACYDCHSNRTRWPWYARLAPASWLVRRDVEAGRRTLNFSEWDRPQRDALEAARAVSEREMPPWYYRLARPDARLSPAERGELVLGLEATLGVDRPRGGPGRSGRGGND